MEAEIVDTYSSLAQRFAVGFLLHIVTSHQGRIINPVHQVPATIFILVAVIVESYLERLVKRIKDPKLAIFRDFASTILLFVGTFLAYLLIALVDSMFEDELGSELTINSIYRPTILIVTISIVITLLKYFAGEITTNPKQEKESKKT